MVAPPGHPGRAGRRARTMDDQRRRQHIARAALTDANWIAAARQRLPQDSAVWRRCWLSTAWPRWARRCFAPAHTRTPIPGAGGATGMDTRIARRAALWVAGGERQWQQLAQSLAADSCRFTSSADKTSSRLSICRFDVFRRRQTSHTIRTQQLLRAGQRGSQVWLHIALANMFGQLNPPASWRCRRRPRTAPVRGRPGATCR